MIGSEKLCGLDESDILTQTEFGYPIHKDILSPLLKLHAKLAGNGIDMQLTSCFRSFDRQLMIWNKKVTGERPILDDLDNILDPEKMSDEETMYAILRFNALPGASRHHWGSEVDVYDRNALPSADYEVQLTPTESDTIFAKIHNKLDQLIEDQECFGFFRPFVEDCGGLSPERWHLSYAPLSSIYQQEYTIEIFKEVISKADILLKDIILARIEELYESYITH